jgi:hypothetical protein
MYKAYYYSPQECGMDEFPPGLMRLSGFEKTKNPDEADIFVIQPGLYHLGVEGIKKLPYLKRNERRHCGLNISDWFKTSTGIPGMWFRCDCTKSVLDRDPTTVAWPWPVEDLGEWSNRPFERDVVFVGWSSTSLTDIACESVMAEERLSSYIKRKDTFYGYQPQGQEKMDAHELFLNTLAGSRVSICARSIPDGVIRYRYWEGVSIGRIVAHICDGYVYPLSDRIDYDAFTIQIPESDTDKTGEIVAEWLSKHDDDDIRDRGKYARQMYERWLCRDKWDDLFGEICAEKIEAMR